MGLADALSAEDRVTVKYSDFCSMVKDTEQLRLIRNALNSGMPRQTILDMLDGASPELKEYRETGLTPDKIREMDRLYTELAAEKAELAAELERSQAAVKELRDMITELTLMGGAATPKKAGVIDPAEVMAAMESGETLKSIATHFGVSTAVIAGIVNNEQKKRAKENQV